MKAKEYFTKYQDMKVDSEEYESFKYDFVDEVSEIIEARHVTTEAGLNGVINELNQKWNAIYNLFVKKCGESPIAYNEFRLIAADHKKQFKYKMDLKAVNRYVNKINPSV